MSKKDLLINNSEDILRIHRTMAGYDDELPSEDLKFMGTSVQDSESILEEATGDINIKTNENMMSPN
jgi:hypothetical protein